METEKDKKILPRIRSCEEQWQSFLTYMDPNALFSDTQKLSMKMAFFAGFTGCFFTSVYEIAEYPEEEGLKLLEILQTEVENAAAMFLTKDYSAWKGRSYINDVVNEAKRAELLYGAWPSAHHGFGVIMEELDEMWDEIKRNDLEKARHEALQVAATALRFLLESENWKLEKK